MFIGVLFALAAGAMWGLIFIGPVLIPEYPAALQSVGRYLAFGLICLPLAWQDRRRLSALNRADWLEALKLAAIGNLLYYFFLSSAIQQIGVPISSMIIGVLPVVVTICSNISYSHRDGKFAWRDLLPSLALVLAGLVCVNLAELQGKTSGYDVPTYLSGIAFAFMAVACWTWYPMRNANWLRVNTTKSPVTWATAQGIATLPGNPGLWLSLVSVTTGPALVRYALGPRPQVFIALMSTIGLLCSWLGTLCWNQASQRLPTALAGQLIVFETLAGLTYAFLLRQEFPSLLTMIGVMILMLGVLKSFRIKRIMPLQSTS